MIPSVLSNQLKTGLRDYIDTSFQITTPLFKDVVSNLLDEPNKVFREPYVSIKLPFRKGSGDKEWFEGINLKFPPYVHQERAFTRLNCSRPESTLIATGTGSGKTECFLYPVLEYCYKHRGEPGIKAILIYPMNSLATDQARRLAELINANDNLRGNVRAGMFVGDNEENPSRMMSEKKIITDKQTLREYPPDILITNYKMLDYLLIRPEDAVLWRNNNFQSLKFIVVDELHTFDGAQGTDLAALIRRLKSRLGTPPEGYLCCIGTSATMGAKSQGNALLQYASNIFGESFDTDSIITEDRITPFEYLNNISTEYIGLPDKEEIERLINLSLSNHVNEEYIKYAIKIWFHKDLDYDYIKSKSFKKELVLLLKSCKFFRDLIEIIDSKSFEYPYIFEVMRNQYADVFENNYEYFAGILDSMLAMISYARVNKADDLQIQIQFWFKELRRMLASVSKDTKLEMSDNLNKEQMKYYLPIVNCRECGATGWATIRNEESSSISISDLRGFYSNYFGSEKDRIQMLFPIEDTSDYKAKYVGNICPKCMSLSLNGEKCSNCGNEELIEVYVPKLEVAKDRHGNSKGFVCPCCESNSGLSLIGAQGSTLISAGISQIFGSKYNDDKKLLTFSDSVQDASHRAGFFNSRTWRFNFRTAVEKFILDSNKELEIKEFVIEFNKYWINKLGKEGYIATFIPPDLTWRRPFENMVLKGYIEDEDEADKLINDIKSRLELEIYFEFGFNSRIGRTLERSGASIIAIDKETVEASIDFIHARLINELGEMRDACVDEIRKIVYGLLIRLKYNGAIYKEILNNYIYRECETYFTKSKINWMPAISKARKPKFLSGYLHNKNSNNYDVITKNSWYQKWIFKNIDIHLIREDLPYDIYRIILQELNRSGILISKETCKGDVLYGISDECLTVSKDVVQASCDKCGHTISIDKDSIQNVNNMPCFRTECQGKYNIMNSKIDFYGKLYRNGDVCRIFAKEHTGLLDREPREKVENEFKKSKEDQKLWDTNLLSCTPTLEMGIDIGDLSTVVLCSVPPGQAQYQQRVGRGGRRDGNSLTIVVANSKAHDLYFYEDPSQMISEAAEPPAIFLDASAVLERQLIAYCFDWWVRSGMAAVPRTLDTVLTSINTEDKDVFPYSFLDYIDNNLSWIYRNFIDIFRDKLSDESIKQLREFAFGVGNQESTLSVKILDAFFAINKQRDSLKKDINSLNKEIRKLKSGVKDSSIDEQIDELKQEKGALKKIVYDINSKNIFNYLCDEGLLPNYAFPESGVILKAVIYRKKEAKKEVVDNADDKKKSKYETFVYEYNRPAVSAIQELAPDNSFYAEGRKLVIDQVDVKLTEPELWRLCPSCSHAELEVKDKNTAQCPRCGSPAWTDSGQVRQMLKIRMVYSNDEYVKSRSGDENDEREQKYFFKQMLVDIESEDCIEKAYSIQDDRYPFGFEFIKKAKLREINFGESNIGEKVLIAGKEEKRKGFKLCKYCGKVKKDNTKLKHAYTCPGKNKPDSETLVESLYLYRELTSEAIRILIPSTTLDTSETRLHTFIAALMLGLKRYFGSVEHLKVCIDQEPVKDSSYRKNYIVLYDVIPGGTGYLKQLMKSPEPMMEILQKALDAIKSCDCYSDSSKDGCYKCLYAYKQSRHISQISSRTAVNMLTEILKNKDKIKELKTIQDIKVNSLFDSELEKRFIEALARSSNANRKVDVEKQIINGKPGFMLRINDSIWEIEPQVSLGINDGVKIPSKPDFILRPVRSANKEVKPIAIFTDGYAYHKNIIGEDMAKRMAIIQSEKYNVWSLTWSDIEKVFKFQGDYYDNYLTKQVICGEKEFQQNFYKYHMNFYRLNDLEVYKKNSFELLLYYLENPEVINKLQSLITIYYMCLSDNQTTKNDEGFKRWMEYIGRVFANNLELSRSIEKTTVLFGSKTINDALHIYSGVNRNITNPFEKSALKKAILTVVLDDSDEKIDDNFQRKWNGYLNLFNLLQFKSNSIFVTEKGISSNLYNELFSNDLFHSDMNTLDVKIEDMKWDEIKDLSDKECNRLIETLIEENTEPPDVVGYELSNEDGENIAFAELAWTDKKIVVLLEEQICFKDKFENQGWNVYLVDDNVEGLLEVIK